MPLKIAAKVDPVDRRYYEREIKPLLNTPNVEFIGEINEQQKGEFLGNAYAYLFPIDWPEPFGLTMIESMACGTPTIDFNCGSVPEGITNGVSGFIVDNTDEAVNAVQQAATLDRAACRAEFMKRFSAPKMALQYAKLYEARVAAKSAAPDSESADPDTEIDSLLTLYGRFSFVGHCPCRRRILRPRFFRASGRPHPCAQVRRHLRRFQPLRRHRAAGYLPFRPLSRRNPLPLALHAAPQSKAAPSPQLHHSRRQRFPVRGPAQCGHQLERRRRALARHRASVPFAVFARRGLLSVFSSAQLWPAARGGLPAAAIRRGLRGHF